MNDNVVQLTRDPGPLSPDMIEKGIERGKRVSALAQAAGMAIVTEGQDKGYPDVPGREMLFDFGMGLGLALMRIAASTPPDMTVDDALKSALKGLSAGMGLGARDCSISLNSIVDELSTEGTVGAIVAFKGD